MKDQLFRWCFVSCGLLIRSGVGCLVNRGQDLSLETGAIWCVKRYFPCQNSRRWSWRPAADQDWESQSSTCQGFSFSTWPSAELARVPDASLNSLLTLLSSWHDFVSVEQAEKWPIDKVKGLWWKCRRNLIEKGSGREFRAIDIRSWLDVLWRTREWKTWFSSDTRS